MKFTVIGRDASQADLVLASGYVSGYHAELVQLDNGDMYIVDKSTNGTFVNGNRITPGKETPVRRDDSVVFADTPLDWNRIDDIQPVEGAKAVINIGSHYLNDIKVQGPNVSRFHARILKMDGGKWYIIDQSRNGTFVNGRKIPKNASVRIKAGDKIVCGGVPVRNPVPASSKVWLYAACSAAGICVVGALVWLIMAAMPVSSAKIYDKYKDAVVFMYCGYHFEAESGTLDLSELPDPDSWDAKKHRFTYSLSPKFIIDDDNTLVEWKNDRNSIVYTGTGFFVGKEGYLATNRHIAKPWETEKLSYSSNVTMVAAAENYFRAKLNKLYEKGWSPALNYISQVKVKGVLDFVMVVPNEDYFDSSNVLNCHEELCSPIEQDLALFRVRDNNYSVKSYVPVKAVKGRNPRIGAKVFTIGFPFGLSLSDVEKTKIQATSSEGNISKNIDKYSFSFTAASYKGASGSPVFNNKGQLVGIVNAGVTISQGYNFAIESECLEQLLKSASVN